MQLELIPGLDDKVQDGQRFFDSFSLRLEELRSRNPAGWILDLRVSPGGSLSSAPFIAEWFGARGTIMTTVNRAGHKQTYNAVEQVGLRIVGTSPVVVLVGPSTASSAEVVASSLQESGATIMGLPTAGLAAGANQRFSLRNGDMRITVQHVLVGPSQRNLDGIGVVPNLETYTSVSELKLGQDSQLESAIIYIYSR